MQTATTDALVGRKLEGRYRILDRIARGGMSTVYAAVDERLDRLVAVKVMNAGLSADPAFSDRFAREARAAARLTHLNAVSVYDQGHEIAADGHHVFLVMELVEGRTLRELIHERGRLSPAEAVSIMEPVLSALSAAHRAGLVHRDVKPENILLSDEGVVKVADFGLARAIETDPSSTRTGLMMGTVAYCSPEQLSRGNADPRSDVYSAGIVFFELLTGQPPYRGESAMNIAYQHVHSRVPAPSSRVRGIPSEIDEIVVAATDSDPTGRPSDAGALLAELADVRVELNLAVMPVPPRVRPRRNARGEHRTDAHRGQSNEHATTAIPREGPVRHDTTVAVEPGGYGAHGGVTHGLRDTGADSRTSRMDARDAALPPPVVIPPPKQRRQKSPRARRRRRGLIAVLVVLALALGSFFGARAFIAWRFAHVPEVAGQSKQAALAELRGAGYRVKVQPAPEYSETIRRNLVLNTEPSSDTRLTTGKTVTVTLSAGPQLYEIPNVRNDSFPDALQALTSVTGLRVASAPARSSNDTIAKNRVVGTTPVAGRKVRGDQKVTIIVSTGPPVVSVPQIGQNVPYDDVRRTLRKAHFTVRQQQDFSSTVPAGDVIGINPSDRAVKFSRITVTVSEGPQMVTIPDIALGTKADDAVAQLTALGLDPQTTPIKVPGLNQDPENPLVWQVLPKAGTSVPIHSTVTVQTF